jgi:hypothetical protein
LIIAGKLASNLPTRVRAVHHFVEPFITYHRPSGSYNHGSAQNIDIISKFICDTLVNSCGADQTARTTCGSAAAAADQRTSKTGEQADAFNAFFLIKTNFAAITPLDDQGRPVDANTTNSQPGAVVAPNFGTCSTPEIKFAPDLDSRKETAFAPVDPRSWYLTLCYEIDCSRSWPRLVSPWFRRQHRCHHPVYM